jgi:hypothetical protein
MTNNRIPSVIMGDDEEPIALPFRWTICGACRGDGKTSAHLGAFSREDLEAQDPGLHGRLYERRL